MSVKLRKRKNADGTTSLRLDIYHNGVRSIETLKNLQLSKSSNLLDREQNKARLQQAEAIAVTRAAELEANNYSMVTDAGKKTIVTDWMQGYIDDYNKKDKRNVQGAQKRFADFLKQEGKIGLTFGQLDALIIEDFIDYLQEKSIGEGASSYYNRFKKMIKQAYRKNMMKDNVLDKVERKVKGKAKKKHTLTIDDLKLISATPTESSEVKRAALFSSVTGLAWIDIKGLTWGKIKLSSRILEIVRAKQKDENVTVTIPLNDTAIKLLGKPGKASEHVFLLPTANGANKTLKALVKRAKIDKEITWHNLRHSYGTNLIYNDVDILTTSKLLGHSSTKHTGRYVEASNQMKQAATDKLNFEL